MRLLQKKIPATTSRATTTTGTTTATAVVPAVLRPLFPPSLPDASVAIGVELDEDDEDGVVAESPPDVEVMTITVVCGPCVESAPVGVRVTTDV